MLDRPHGKIIRPAYIPLIICPISSQRTTWEEDEKVGGPKYILASSGKNKKVGQVHPMRFRALLMVKMGYRNKIS